MTEEEFEAINELIVKRDKYLQLKNKVEKLESELARVMEIDRERIPIYLDKTLVPGPIEDIREYVIKQYGVKIQKVRDELREL